jgi:hypothetical protein
VISRYYFTRQATTLLKLAKSTTDTNLAAALVDKAADLKSRLDESDVPDPTSLRRSHQRGAPNRRPKDRTYLAGKRCIMPMS